LARTGNPAIAKLIAIKAKSKELFRNERIDLNPRIRPKSESKRTMGVVKRAVTEDKVVIEPRITKRANPVTINRPRSSSLSFILR
jgi:hypothetical protein